VPTDHAAFVAAEQGVKDRTRQLLSVKGTRTVDWFHRELGKIMWDYCGMSRSQAGLEKAMSEIPALADEFERDVRVIGSDADLNQTLERAFRVSDYFELSQLMCRDALEREESCGGHFREESQTDEGEALRDDEHFANVAAWEWNGPSAPATKHVEPLEFENVKLSQRSYK